MTQGNKAELKKLHEYLFRIPPDFKAAKQHGSAMKIRVSPENLKVDESNQWIDCKRLLPEHTRQLGLCESPQNLIEHGDGFPLLFQFLKFIIIMFISVLILQGIFFILASIIESDRRDITLVNLLSVHVIVERDANGKHIADDTLINLYEYLTLLTNILQMILIAIFWVKQERLRTDLDLK